MPIRYRDQQTRLGSVATTLEGMGGSLVGTFVAAVTRTGVIASQLDAFTGLLQGNYTSAPNRTGVIGTTLAGVSGLLQGNFFVAGPATDVTTLQITSTVGGTLLPFTIGQPFKQGDVPTGQYITADIPDFQADVKNRWPDGSVKFAKLSGRRTLTANVAATITIRKTATPPAGAALNLTQLRTAVASATIARTGGITATTDLASVLAGTPHRTESAGPQMIEAHWRAPVSGDSHLEDWIYVRAYAGGQAEIEIVGENGRLMVTGAGTKSYNLAITVNGTQRLPAAAQAVTHYHHTRWTRSFWYGTDPAITPTHNLTYLKSTKLVPNTRTATPSAAAWTGSGNWLTLGVPATEATAPALFAVGNFRDAPSAGGSSAAIGLLPAWEMLHLTSGDKRAFDATIHNARLFGKYPFYYRDESTVRSIQYAPPQLTQKPLLAFQSGSGNYGWVAYGIWGQAAGANTIPPASGALPLHQNTDGEHQPSAPYYAYLLTGRYPFIEACQFAATASLLQKGTIRGGASCIYAGYNDAAGDAARILGWTVRQAVWAATITPDSEATMQTEFRTIVDNNVTFRLSYMTAGAAANNLGLIAIRSGETRESGYVVEKPWMQAYAALAFAQAYDNQINTSAGARTTHQNLLTQVYKCSVGLFGTASGYNYRRAGIYYFAAMSGGDLGNDVGPNAGATPLADWGAVYAASMANLNPAGTPFPALSAADGQALNDVPLGANGGPPYEYTITSASLLAESFTAQAAMPLVYAVDHGAAGAAAAYNRYVTSPTYTSYSSGFVDRPLTGYVTRTSEIPSWVPAAGTWAQVSLNTVDATIKGDFPPRFLSSRSISAKCENYSGAIWNPYIGTYGAWVFWGGCHSATDLGNEIYVWEADTRLWRRESDPTYPGSVAVSPNWVTGDVNSAYDEPLRTYGELVTAGAPAASHSRWNPCILPPGNGIGAYGALAIPYQSAFHIGGNTQSSQAHVYDFATRAWSRVGDGGISLLGGWTSCADTNGNLWRALSSGGGTFQKLAAGASTWTTVTPSGFSSVSREGPLCYIPNSDLVAAWRLVGGVLRLYLMNAASPTNAVVVPTLSGTAPSVPAAGGYGSPVPAMGMTWCAPLNAICGFLEGSKQVWALVQPTSPLTQAWTWQQLTASNTPTPFTASAGDPELYNRFQYAPALRSFVVTRQIGNSEMWAFRPTGLA